jgi:hypothetical protein
VFCQIPVADYVLQEWECTLSVGIARLTDYQGIAPSRMDQLVYQPLSDEITLAGRT